MRIDDLKEKYSPIARLNLLPPTFTARVESIEEKEDAKFPTYQALYIRARLTNQKLIEAVRGSVVIQKFRPMHQAELLIPAMEKLGIRDTDDLIGKTFVFSAKKPSFDGSNPRWVPTEVDGKQAHGKSTKKSANN